MTEKVVLVTGASGGIGRAIILEFAKAGYNVAINYNLHKDNALLVQKEAAAYDVKSLIIKADVTKTEDVDAMVEETLKEFKRIDVLVNCAGITRDKTLVKMTKDMWDDVIDTNINGVFNVTKIIVPIMIEQKEGTIINISSIVGLQGNYGQTNYSTTKAGIIGFTKSLAKELASHGITVNAIAPGFIDTPMTEQIPQNIKEKIIENIPLKRMGKPEEIAEAAMFLSKGRYITGQIISVNGGML